MAHVQFISKLLGTHLMKEQIGYEDLGDMEGIILLKQQLSLPRNYLCIATEGIAKTQLPLMTLKYPATILIAESRPDAAHNYTYDFPGHNILITDMELIDLYNKVNIMVCNYKTWDLNLMKALCEGQNLPQIIGLAGDMIKAPFFLFNVGYKVTCSTSVSYFDDNYADDIRSKGYLSYEAAAELQSSPCITAGKKYRLTEYTAPGTSHRYYICEILNRDTAIASLLSIAPPDHQIDMANLTIHLSHIIRRFLLGDGENLFEAQTALTVFVSDLIENRLTDTVEIKNRIRALAYPIEHFAYIILVRFDMETDRGKIPYGYIISQLEEIFPDTNITVYNHDICILYHQKNRSYGKLDFNYQALQDILERYQAYAGISNGSRHLNYLRTLYLISSDTIKLGVPLKRHEMHLPDRVFHYEDYSTYYVIDLSVQHYIQQHGHDDIIYLSHPSIIAIYRYDSQHNSDLLDVLFYYLINGNNISRTAKALYMHRNTIQNKLAKITAIINLPLDDGYVQQRMVFSCLLMRYYENYMNNQVKL